MARARVLLIDDDLELLRQMSLAFVGAGYSVQVAQDGQIGMARFHEDPADLVVSDIIMPNREGIETIVSLRKASPSLKIVAISGGYRVGPADFLNLAGHVGSDAVLGKPFKPSALVAIADELLGKASAADAA